MTASPLTHNPARNCPPRKEVPEAGSKSVNPHDMNQMNNEDNTSNAKKAQAPTAAESAAVEASIPATSESSVEVSPVIPAGSSVVSESFDATDLPAVVETRIPPPLRDTSPPLRPGVSNATLRANGVTIMEPRPGRSCEFKIPYFAFEEGEGGRHAVDDGNGGDFHRLRLDRPASEGGKYTQGAGTPACAYFPVGLAVLLRQHRYVIITEGEFKALSLVEAGYPALAIGGIDNFRRDGQLLPELVELFDWMERECGGCEAIHYLGDADTAINGQFSGAAVTLREALACAHVRAELRLPRMPIAEMCTRKGIDDARADMGPEEFGPYMENLLGSALQVPAGLGVQDLAMILFERDEAGIGQLLQSAEPTAKPKLKEKLARLANAVSSEAADDLTDFVVENGLFKKKIHFKQTMKEQAKKLAEEMDKKRVREPVEMFYCPSGSKNYLYEGNSGFVRVDRTGALNYLHERGHSKKAASSGELSEAERYLTEAEMAAVDWTGPLAGRKLGIHDHNGQSLLVTKSPALLEPEEGNWDTIRDFIETRLDYNPAEEPDPKERQAARAKAQSPYFYGWLAHAAKSLYLESGRFVPSQALVLCGGAGVGKNTLQEEIITELLGGRQADPFDHMEGSSSFNGELAGAEHWCIADKQSSAKHADREKMKSCLKEGCVNRSVRINAKHQQPINVEVWRRISISMNESAECLRVLPSLSSDFADKLMILHVVGTAFHGAGTEFSTYQDWRTQIQAELPAFLHYLLHAHAIGPAMVDSRYGVVSYHDPEMVQRMHEQSQEGRLEEILNQYLFNGKVPPEEMSAQRIYQTISQLADYGELSSIGCDSALKMGTLLAKLVEQKPERFSKRMLRGQTSYRIAPPIIPADSAEVEATEADVTEAREPIERAAA
jgi:hypothetical protein